MPSRPSIRFAHAALTAVLASWLACGLPAAAQTLHGLVAAVDTGDVIILLDAAQQRHRIRLSGIAAPHRGQPFASQSRNNLARWVDQREVFVECGAVQADTTRRGVVFVDGHDVNLEQVRAGLAWWDRRTAGEQSSEERDIYEQAEHAARYRKLGLWANPDAVPPWEWGARHAPTGAR